MHVNNIGICPLILNVESDKRICLAPRASVELDAEVIARLMSQGQLGVWTRKGWVSITPKPVFGQEA